MIDTPRFTRNRLQRGFSLIEVLVALVILAVGLLGLAALQARGLKFGHDAYTRSQSTALAGSIMEAMRMAGAGNGAGFTGGDPRGTTPCTTLTHRGVGTNPQLLACWYQDLADILPSGAATITSIGSNQYTISVTWYDREQKLTKTQAWTVQLDA